MKSAPTPTAAPATKLNLTDKAYAIIRRDIVSCALRPGAFLTEQQFRDRYGLTVAITRSALGRLAQDSLIMAEARRGYVVAPLTLRDVVEVFDARIIVESGAARLATEKMTAENLAAVTAAADPQHVASKKGPGFLAANRAFHLAVAHASGNQRIVRTVERLLDESERVLHLGLVRFDRSDAYSDEHREVVALMKDGKAEEAAQLTAQQIAGGKQMVLAAIRSSPQFMNLDLGGLTPDLELKLQPFQA